MSRITESELILPSLYLISEQPVFLHLIEYKFTERVQPTGKC